MSTRSNKLRRFSGAKVTSTSMSLSAVKSSLSTDPKKASSLTCHLRQKSSMSAIGTWMLVGDGSLRAMRGTVAAGSKPVNPDVYGPAEHAAGMGEHRRPDGSPSVHLLHATPGMSSAGFRPAAARRREEEAVDA